MKIGYLISSNKAYFDSTYLVLNRSLIHAGIDNANIIWIVGGHEKDEKVNDNIYYVNYNSFDLTAIIGFLDLNINQYHNFSHVFLLHDTCEAGPDFKSKVENFNPDNKYVSTCRIFTMGMFAIDLLEDNKDLLASLKNIDKNKAIYYETYFYDNYGKISYQNIAGYSDEYVFHDNRDVYGTGYARRACYLEYLDLYKYPRQGPETSDCIL